MTITIFDPRILTGPAFILLGAFFMTIALRLWFVSPVNRVFRLGPFVTKRGMEAVLGMRTLFFAFGALGIVSGVHRCNYWFVTPEVHAPSVLFLGAMEAGLAIWAAYLAVVSAVRLWRLK